MEKEKSILEQYDDLMMGYITYVPLGFPVNPPTNQDYIVKFSLYPDKPNSITSYETNAII